MTNDNETLVPVVEPPENMAKLMVTYNGQQGDLPDLVPYDATDANIKIWASEATRTGGVVGIDAIPDADFQDFVIDRFGKNEVRDTHVLILRPKTPFGKT